MRGLIWFLSGVVALPVIIGAAGIIFLKTSAKGFSAQAPPSVLEIVAARTARRFALPSGARERRNPIANSNEVLSQARAHWADHCALCHGNDGSGQTEMGSHTYPPAPDMRKERTQHLTDGELFYIIENGIRLSGMPAWGGSHEGGQDSWKLVHFIRHLPDLSASEISAMETLNPKSPEQLEEEKQEEQFLKGQPVNEAPKQQHHH